LAQSESNAPVLMVTSSVGAYGPSTAALMVPVPAP
jgi:hypothetical protein